MNAASDRVTGTHCDNRVKGAHPVLPAFLSSRECFVMGYPMAHSLSPALFAGAFAAAGLPFTYSICNEPNADNALRTMNNQQFLLMNVSTPYKTLALRAATTVRQEAMVAGGANVLIPLHSNSEQHKSISQLYADNVDGVGCIAFLQSQHAWPCDARVVICGTGPTAFAIAHMALCEGALSVCLLSRDYQRASERLSQYLQRVQGVSSVQGVPSAKSNQDVQVVSGMQIARDMRVILGAQSAQDEQSVQNTQYAQDGCDAHNIPSDSSAFHDTFHTGAALSIAQPPCLLKRTLPSYSYLTHALHIDTYNHAEDYLNCADVVINASTLGMHPHDVSPIQARYLHSQHVIFDVTYAQPTTAFLEAAHAVHARAYNGLGMLVYQALEGFFDMCTLHCIPLTVSTDTLLRAMLEKSGIDKSFSRKCERA